MYPEPASDTVDYLEETPHVMDGMCLLCKMLSFIGPTYLQEGNNESCNYHPLNIFLQKLLQNIATTLDHKQKNLD